MYKTVGEFVKGENPSIYDNRGKQKSGPYKFDPNGLTADTALPESTNEDIVKDYYIIYDIYRYGNLAHHHIRLRYLKKPGSPNKDHSLGNEDAWPPFSPKSSLGTTSPRGNLYGYNYN